jgi:hypothetical protein
MPKKRNTRKHKISIEQKRHAVHEASTSSVVSTSVTAQTNQQAKVPSGMTFSLPTNLQRANGTTKKPAITVTTAISTENYGYLTNDLLRTAILSGAIVIAELLIKIFFRA